LPFNLRPLGRRHAVLIGRLEGGLLPSGSVGGRWARRRYGRKNTVTGPVNTARPPEVASNVVRSANRLKSEKPTKAANALAPIRLLTAGHHVRECLNCEQSARRPRDKG